MDETVLQVLRTLAQRDRDLAAETLEQVRLDRAVSAIRTRSEEITAFFAGHSEQAERLRQIEARESDAVERQKVELEEAHAELEVVKSDEQRERVERRLARAADHAELAERALKRARAERRRFDETANRLSRELRELEARARTMGAVDDDLVAWASRIHAELFVAISQLDAQREQIIREANELATSILGEPTFGSMPAKALERVESYWTSSPGQVSDKR